MKYRARFQQQRQAAEPEKMDYGFELSWRRPELADPPLELLRLIDQTFPIKSFELTTDNGR
jgi:putative Mg2+ transporter-C (MgtC) family protein